MEEWIGKSYGKSPFPKRDSNEIFIQPSTQFNTTIQKLNAFSNYVLDYANDFTDEKNKINYWTILHFHKRAISSPHALICSVDNRIEEIDKKLNKKYQAIEKIENFLSLQEAGQVVFDGVETDRLSEEERDIRSDKVVLNKSMEILAKEKKLLEDVKKEAKILRGTDHDTKVRRLVEEIIPDRFKNSKKIIIFTRYIDTLRYIVENLNEKIEGGSIRYKDVDVFSVHGQLASQKRMQIYDEFLKNDAAILVSTDCIAEGIDLQFSSNQVINYELTWNPNRLEQRNGRVDRFGQPEDEVFIRTLIMNDTLEVDILDLLVKKAQKIKDDYGFVPGFFGDPKDVIDRIAERKKKKKKEAGTMDVWIKMAPQVMDELVSIFYNKDNVEEMIKDSFYGHNNINLEEIEKRMKLTQEKIGDCNTLFEFLEAAVKLYQGQIKLARESKESMEIHDVSLPEEVQHDLKVEINDGYKITKNMKVAAVKKDVDGVSLKNPLIAGLIEKVKNEAFIEDHRFYGRTAAFASPSVDRVTVIHSIKIRYVIHTVPKTLTEEIALVGLDLYSNEEIENTKVEEIMNGDMKNHPMPEIQVKKQLEKALKNEKLKDIFQSVAEAKKEHLVLERNELIESLKNQGMTTDLEGINEVDIVGTDHLTTMLVYPGGND